MLPIQTLGKPSPNCNAWYELFFGLNRGCVYTQFIEEQKFLTDHLDGCEICRNAVQQFMFPHTVADLKSMNPDNFSKAIRVGYKVAQSSPLAEDDE